MTLLQGALDPLLTLLFRYDTSKGEYMLLFLALRPIKGTLIGFLYRSHRENPRPLRFFGLGGSKDEMAACDKPSTFGPYLCCVALWQKTEELTYYKFVSRISNLVCLPRMHISRYFACIAFFINLLIVLHAAVFVA